MVRALSFLLTSPSDAVDDEDDQNDQGDCSCNGTCNDGSLRGRGASVVFIVWVVAAIKGHALIL